VVPGPAWGPVRAARRPVHRRCLPHARFLRFSGRAGTPAPGGSLFNARATAEMAGLLGITGTRAQSVTDQIERLAARSGGIDPADPGFVAIARGAGVTPQRPASALDRVKRDTAQG
jgi:hypothetical protein